MTQRDQALYLDITPVTIRNWKKKKPNLYKTIMLGFAFDEAVEKSKANYEELKVIQEKLLK